MRTAQEKLKHNYIVENIEKGYEKIKETMILSSFCFDSRLKDLKPLFQYYIKKETDNNYYFYDLYYEDVKIMIEIDEEHHETDTEKINDQKKEKRAKETLGCDFYRISFHENYGVVSQQVEMVKDKILKKIQELGEEKTRWNENQFDPITYINGVEKTILAFISPLNKISNLNEMPLQISKEIHKVDEVNIIYLTGGTGTVASAYKVTPNDWGMIQGSSFHTGQINYENSILKSGSTFYSSNKNIILSPDLEKLRRK